MSDDLIERLRQETVANYISCRTATVAVRPAQPCDVLVRRGEVFNDPAAMGGRYCREIHPDGHQCTWVRSLHSDGRQHRCRGCRWEWDA